MRLREISAAGVLIAILGFPVSSVACSLVSCLDKGAEMRRDLVVRVTHEGRPLPGVSVQVTNNFEEKANKVFAGKTGADGTVRVANLSPGDYWLNAELLGITAGLECFHVASRSSRRAKRTVNYKWGDLAPVTRQIAGRLIDSRPGEGDNPLWNTLHRVDVPISEAKLTLQDPMTGAAYKSATDAEGHFSFRVLPTGTYVLHIDSGTVPGGRDYDSTDLLVKLSHTAKPDGFLLKRREAGAGSCGGTHLELQDIPN